MHDALIAELETASRIVMQPANVITAEQRQLAEAVIMKFRRTPAPYAICRQIFEQSACDLLLFESADTLKRAIIAEWHQLADDDRLMLRQYLLTYCIERDIPAFIRAKVLQVVAIMIKRASIADASVERLQIMHEMIAMGTQHQQYLGCRILHTVMQEFLITIKSDDTGLTFEEHFKAKKMFELSDLKRIYVLVFQAAQKLLPSLDVANAQHVALVGEYLAIFELIMLWGYVSPLLPKRLITALESSSKTEQSTALRLGAQWAPVMLEPAVLEVFFAIYWKVRSVPELQHRTMTCLVQFSTLNGPVIDSADTRSKYVTNYLTHFLQLLGQGQVAACEAHSVAMIFRKILLHTNESSWVNVPEDIRQTVLQQMFSISCSYMELAVAEEQEQCDDLRYRPALDYILGSWLLILQMRRAFVLETIQQYSVQMFNKYLQSRLSWAALNGAGVQRDPSAAASGARNRHDSCGVDEEDGEEGGQTENDRYEEQLVVVGMLGRENLACTLPTLCGLLEERTLTFREQLLRIYTAQTVQPSDAELLEPIYDDIQWLTMIAAHVLAIHSNCGEMAVIPTEVRRFGLERMRAGQTDVTATLKLLAAPAQTVAEVENAEAGADLVVRLVAAVFRLCDLETKAIELKMSTVLSPEVTRSLMWFVLQWSQSYLLEAYAERSGAVAEGELAPEPEYSVALREAFAAGTEGGKWTVDFLLNKICVNVRSFGAEQRVVDTSLDIFVQAAMRSAKAPIIFQSELFKQIMDLRHLDVPKAKLLRGLMLIAVCVTPEELRNQYLVEILSPIQESFNKLEWQQAMSSVSDHGKSTAALQLTRLLDEIRACCAGATQHINKSIYAIFEPIMHNLADVLDLFHNFQSVVVAIIELLCTVVERLRGAETKLNDICIRVVRVYVRHNANRVTALKATAEEDSLEDLELLLKLSKHFLTAAMFDLLADSENDGEEVCSTILQYILPMVTMDMLRYPRFCLHFYQTLRLFVEKSLMQVQPAFLQAIVQCMTMGLQAFGAEIQSVCLELLNTCASNVYYDQNPESYMYGALRPSVQQLFGMVLTLDIDTDNRPECCRALFTLLCVYRQEADAVREVVLQAYADQSRVEQLRAELVELVQKDALFNNRGSHMQFGKRFEKFLANLTSLC